MISQLPVRVPVYSLQFSLNIERFPHTASFQNKESHPLSTEKLLYWQHRNKAQSVSFWSPDQKFMMWSSGPERLGRGQDCHWCRRSLESLFHYVYTGGLEGPGPEPGEDDLGRGAVVRPAGLEDRVQSVLSGVWCSKNSRQNSWLYLERGVI